MTDGKGRDLIRLPGDDIERITVEEAITEAKDRLELLQRVTEISLKRTYKQDWVAFPGGKDEKGQPITKPYLTAAGAERIRPLFGITIDNQEVKRYDDPKDGSYMYVISGVAHFRGDAMAVLGTCTSKDQFFSTRYETGAEGKRERVTLPAEEVNQENVLKSARSDMVRNAVVGILGLRNLTWDLLKQFGFTPDQAVSVRYADRKEEQTTSRPTGQKKPDPAPKGASSGTASQGAPKGNGAQPPDGKSWFSSLQAAAAKAMNGQPIGGPKTLELLAAITTFTPKATPEKPNPTTFGGFKSWEALSRSTNCERASMIAFKRLEELQKPPAPTPAPAEAPAPTSGPEEAPPPEDPQEGLGI